MFDPGPIPSPDLTSRLSRRAAVRAYAPPALALIAAGTMKGHHGTSGTVHVPNPGGPKPGSQPGPKKP